MLGRRPYAAHVPDAQFAIPRLAEIYDALDGDRDDLDHYENIVRELGARSVLDVGCGTGSLAVRLAVAGFAVTAVDPAVASLDIARRKPDADRVRWVHGSTADVPPLSADIAVMTGNVAQVFLSDESWSATLVEIRGALRAGGHFVFESRDPQRRAWEEWTAENTRSTVDLDDIGQVEYFVELLDVSLPYVSFRWTYRFERDGAELTSDSTLRFRDEAELRKTLVDAGFVVGDVRDAPDRPGREFVFIADVVSGPAGAE